MSDIDKAAAEAGYLMWCFSEGYGLKEDRDVLTSGNWLLDPDERLHPDDVVQKAQLLALGRDLVAAVRPLALTDLRAEVDGLRERASQGQGDGYMRNEHRVGQEYAYEEVLERIDRAAS
ncbi:MAG: hypothetical protein RLZZ403_842 [Pseudomonadota bacterium]